AGMGEGNVEEFGAAREGRGRLTAFCEEQAAEFMSVEPRDLRAAMAPHLSDVDGEALTGELAEYLHSEVVAALSHGVQGWVDDDYAFMAPWGFDVGAISVPTLVWQGEQDLMVPVEHAHWLARHVAGAESRIFSEEGHLTLAVNR